MLAFANILPASAGIKEDVAFLSDPMLKGRGFATQGAVAASWYISGRFASLGLETSFMSYSTGSGVGHNVIGIHREKPSAKSYVLVMAHYDGIGTYDGTLYPGADSNASGTAVLLALAEALSGTEGNFIFAAVDGYSHGHAGARTLAAAGYKISMVVNLDTIGSVLSPPNKYRPDYLIALGGKPYQKAMDKANIGPRVRLYYNYYSSAAFTDYFYRKASDQAPFLEKGITSVMFTSGITMNTNKPSDTPETLDYEVMGRRCELILNWLRTL